MTSDKEEPKPLEEQPAWAMEHTEIVSQTGAARLPTDPKGVEALIGTRLGKYEIVSILGRGGMGVVLRAHDRLIQRDVAIKLLPDDLATDATMLKRFLSEARAAGKLHHPNVVSIFEIGQEGRSYYLVMELVAGGSVEDYLDKHGPISVLEATRLTIDACKGLEAAHAMGLIHRDIKPANLMRTADGAAKIADFGLVKGVSGKTQELTQPGVVVGTPYFMSPEQCETRPVDGRSDLYSLGATYYALLTAKYPFHEASSITQLMYSHCYGPIPDPRAVNAAIPEACAGIVGRAMAKKPEERYASARDMLADLEALATAISSGTALPMPALAPADSKGRSGLGGKEQPSSAAALPSPAAPFWAEKGLWIGIAATLGAVLLIAILWRPWQRGSDPVPPGGPVVKVGVLHSLTGTMAASETVVVDACALAVDEVNQAGGVLGRPVKAVIVDGRSDPQTFASGAEKLITEEKVCTVFGCWTSASRKTVLPVFEKHDHLLVYPLQYEGLETSPNIFYLGAAPNQQILPALDWAVTALKKKRFFLVGSDYVFPRAAHEIIKDHLKKGPAPAEVVGEHFLPLGGQDVGAAIKAIQASGADMILNTINGDTNVAFFRALRAAGIKSTDIPCLSFSIGEEGLRNLNPADLEGDFAAWTYFQAIGTPVNQEFVRRFHEKYPQRTITDPAESAYVGVKIWAQAVNEAQSLDPKKIRRAMLNQRFAAPGGEVRIDPDTQHSFKTPRVGQITGEGQFRVVWSAPGPTPPMPYPSTRSAADWKAFLHDLYMGWGKQWSAP